MLSVPEVDSLLTGRVAVLPPESCALADSVGRVLREPITADRDLPPHDRVTMDGIAVAGAALQRDGKPLRIEGEARAGDRRKRLGDPGDGALRVMTGAVLPAGSDTVIRSEDLRIEGDRVWLQPEQPIVAGQNVHRQGSDTRAGTTVLSPGRRISAADIAVLASVGRAQVSVGRRPRVAVISTGDELVDVGQPIADHQVRRSNIYVVATALSALGYQVDPRHLPDDPDKLSAGVIAALATHEVLITTGAVSKGSADFLPGVYQRIGAECYLHGVRQRPGKPLWVGGTEDGRRVFALPGNPVSVMMCLYRYVVPYLAAAEGAAPAPQMQAALAEEVRFPPPLTLFLPVLLAAAGGTLTARPAPAQNSGDFLALVGSDGFLELAADRDRFAAGSVLPLYPWQPLTWGLADGAS
jgi:molybdopterin molybdotransferase